MLLELAISPSSLLRSSAPLHSAFALFVTLLSVSTAPLSSSPGRSRTRPQHLCSLSLSLPPPSVRIHAPHSDSPPFKCHRLFPPFGVRRRRRLATSVIFFPLARSLPHSQTAPSPTPSIHPRKAGWPLPPPHSSSSRKEREGRSCPIILGAPLIRFITSGFSRKATAASEVLLVTLNSIWRRQHIHRRNPDAPSAAVTSTFRPKKDAPACNSRAGGRRGWRTGIGIGWVGRGRGRRRRQRGHDADGRRAHCEVDACFQARLLSSFLPLRRSYHPVYL